MKWKILLLILSVFYICCNEKNKKIDEPDGPSIYPVEIEFTEFDIQGFNCGFPDQNFPFDIPINDGALMVINNENELENLIVCFGDSSYPEIDFSKHSLLLAKGNSSNGISKIFKNVQKISENEYQMNVDVRTGITGWIEPWTIAIITSKISDDCKIELNFMKPSQELGCNCKDELYYYKEGNSNKNFLSDQFVNNYLVIGFERHIVDEEIVVFINNSGIFNPVKSEEIYYYPQNNDSYYYPTLLVNTKNKYTCSQFKEIITTMEESPIVAYTSFTFSNYGYDIRAWSNIFHLSVKDKDDLSDLYAIVQETNSLIIEQNEFSPHRFMLVTNKFSKYKNGLQMANYFYETGKFISAECSFNIVK